jgi:hypothetical protein
MASQWSPLESASVALNELFMTLTKTGFTEEQALRLIAYLIEDMKMSESED